jgi:hypothetical protein
LEWNLIKKEGLLKIYSSQQLPADFDMILQADKPRNMSYAV